MSNATKATPTSPTAAGDLAAATRVLRLEAEGIAALIATLDGRLQTAIDMMFAAKGRIVVTGMGKSGHVARKIASTLASTRTPALYVHPGEASHGDLGMITDADVVLALSNSGETAELSDLVDYTRRFSIPLIAVTGRGESSLAEAADVALVLPPVKEACPLGLAPTTSTTVMLALGDAIAVALFERRGFSTDQFQMLHPGGRLGHALLKVADIMHSGDSIPLVGGEAPMSDVLVLMTAKSFGCVGILGEDGKLAGVITDGDLRRKMSPDLLRLPAARVMSPDPTTIRPQALAAEAVNLMNTRTITNLFVIEDGRPIGILHIHDCLRAGVI